VVTQSELPLVLTPTEATVIAERWMAEARVSRDTARFALPRSKLDIGVGDTVTLQGQRYRVDRLEQSDLQLIEAMRIDSAVYEPAEVSVPSRGWSPYQASVPVYPLFMDLPLLKGTEVEHAPHACVAASPWPGPIALWSSVADDAYTLNRQLGQAAVLGVTETELPQAEPGRWDRGPALRVRVESGALQSANALAVLSGANLAAIGDGSPENWEIFQFTAATLVAPKTYELSMRLRGQAGSDGAQPPAWPVGSLFVLLDDALQQIDLPLSARGLQRFYRFGPADLGYDAANSVLQTAAFNGIGLRPYAVAHLTARQAAGGDIALQWVRRTRIDGDNWQSIEVPLGEDSEAYLVRVLQGTSLKREVTVSAASWTYTTAQQAADAITGPISISVAQLSQRFGAGPARTVTV